MIDTPLPLKPRLRGVWHQWACIVSVPLGVALVFRRLHARRRVSRSACTRQPRRCCSGSARLPPRELALARARRWMRRLDHSMIFMLIAGTYTPFAVISCTARSRSRSSSGCGRWRGRGPTSTSSGSARRSGCSRRSTSRSAGRPRRRPQLLEAIGICGLCAAPARRRHVHRRRGHLRDQAAQPGADGVRVPRDLPRARRRGGGASSSRSIAFWVVPPRAERRTAGQGAALLARPRSRAALRIGTQACASRCRRATARSRNSRPEMLLARSFRAAARSGRSAATSAWRVLVTSRDAVMVSLCPSIEGAVLQPQSSAPAGRA